MPSTRSSIEPTTKVSKRSRPAKATKPTAVEPQEASAESAPAPAASTVSIEVAELKKEVVQLKSALQDLVKATITKELQLVEFAKKHTSFLND
jgi:hypothetical protein